MKDLNSGNVCCGYCGQEYKAGIHFNQGYNVASYLYADGVIGCFGSNFRDMIFIFEEAQERTGQFMGPSVRICDFCICRLIEEDLLSLVDDYTLPFRDFNKIYTKGLEIAEHAMLGIIENIKEGEAR